MQDLSFLQSYPVEVRKFLIEFQKAALRLEDQRYRVAFVHCRQRLINRLNDFVGADGKALGTADKD